MMKNVKKTHDQTNTPNPSGKWIDKKKAISDFNLCEYTGYTSGKMKI